MMKRMIGLALLMAALCIGMTAHADNASEVRKKIESSLLVSGTITISPNGSVVAYTLDSTDALGDVLRAFVEGTIQQWRFEPVHVDGKVVTAKMPMSLRLKATPQDDGTTSVTIASTHFGSERDVPANEDVRSSKLTPPKYPDAALSLGAKGTVYLIVQVGRNGAVVNVAAEQVNLRVVGTEEEMAAVREQFTDAAVRAAKRWKFKPPTAGVIANKDTWLVRVPVDFVLWGNRPQQAKAAQWDSYVPGPRNFDMPWAEEDLQAAGSPDALSEGGIYPLQQGAKLLPSPAT